MLGFTRCRSWFSFNWGSVSGLRGGWLSLNRGSLVLQKEEQMYEILLLKILQLKTFGIRESLYSNVIIFTMSSRESADCSS